MPVTLPRRLVASLVTGFVVGLTAFLAASFALFLSLQEGTANLGPIAHYFAFPSIIFFVLFAIAAMLDGLGGVARRIIFSVITAILGAYIGAVIYFNSAGDPTSQALTDATTSLLNNNLVFMIVAVIAAITIGARVYDWVIERPVTTSTTLTGV